MLQALCCGVYCACVFALCAVALGEGNRGKLFCMLFGS